MIGLVLMVLMVIAGMQWATAAGDSPLQRLKDRSAETRWKSLRERMSDRRESRIERRERRKTGSEEPEDEAIPEEAPLSEPVDSSAKVLPTPTPPGFGHPVPPARSVPTKPSPAILLPEPTPTRIPAQDKIAKPDVPAVPAAPRLTPPVEAKPLLVPPSVQSTPTSTKGESSGIQTRPVTMSLPLTVPGDVKPDAPELKPLEVIPVPSNTQEQPELNPLENVETSSRRKIFSDEIKPISAIDPFATYEPDASIRETDPARHLCPVPEHMVALGQVTNSRCPEISGIPDQDDSYVRNFAHLDYCWAASNINYFPLYFEDPRAERYGHLHHPLVQPFASVGRFNWQLIGLPYQMAINPVAKCVYPLGYFRPGDCDAPKLYHQVPLSPEAAFITAEVYTGLFFLFP